MYMITILFYRINLDLESRMISHNSHDCTCTDYTHHGPQAQDKTLTNSNLDWAVLDLTVNICVGKVGLLVAAELFLLTLRSEYSHYLPQSTFRSTETCNIHKSVKKTGGRGGKRRRIKPLFHKYRTTSLPTKARWTWKMYKQDKLAVFYYPILMHYPAGMKCMKLNPLLLKKILICLKQKHDWETREMSHCVMQ